MDRQIKRHILNNYGIDCNLITKLGFGVMNENYHCRSKRGQYVFKLYNQKKDKELKFEIEVLNELSKHDFEAPKIVKTSEGFFYENFDNKPSILYGFIEGDHPADISQDFVENLGRLMGKFHKALLGFMPSTTKATWDPEEIVGLINYDGDAVLKKKFKHAKDILSFVKKEILKYKFPPSLPRGVTHQDIKPENVLIRGGKIAVVDFDNSYVGAYLHDITTTLIWVAFCDNKVDASRVTGFLRGYEESRRLTEDEKKYLNEALKWRLLREMFIGMYVTEKYLDVAEERSMYFYNLYKKFKPIDIK